MRGQYYSAKKITKFDTYGNIKKKRNKKKSCDFDFIYLFEVVGGVIEKQKVIYQGLFYLQDSVYSYSKRFISKPSSILLFIWISRKAHSVLDNISHYEFSNIRPNTLGFH